MQRLAVTLTCAFAVLALPLAALAQTQAGTGTDGAKPQTDVAKLPVCGQPAPVATNSTSKGDGKATTSKARKRAAARKARARAAAAKAEPTRATLTLDQEDQETVTGAAFGRGTAPQPMTLVYRVAGCRVTDDLALPVSPLPTGPVKTAGARPLPLGAVQIDDVDADSDRYVVHLRVFVSSGKASDQGGTAMPEAPTPAPTGTPSRTSANVAEFPGLPSSSAEQFEVEPGSYTSFVRLKAPWMRTVATPVTVTRSEDTELIPIIIGIVGGLAGFVLFVLLRWIHGEQLLVREGWVLALTGFICVAVGAGTAFFTSYLNQEIWTFNANALALFTAAFTASTAGVTAGLLTGIYREKATAEPDATGKDGNVTPA
jgi:hypothetical protein